jgi:hypothetical protein
MSHQGKEKKRASSRKLHTRSERFEINEYISRIMACCLSLLCKKQPIDMGELDGLQADQAQKTDQVLIKLGDARLAVVIDNHHTLNHG